MNCKDLMLVIGYKGIGWKKNSEGGGRDPNNDDYGRRLVNYWWHQVSAVRRRCSDMGAVTMATCSQLLPLFELNYNPPTQELHRKILKKLPNQSIILNVKEKYPLFLKYPLFCIWAFMKEKVYIELVLVFFCLIIQQRLRYWLLRTKTSICRRTSKPDKWANDSISNLNVARIIKS